MEWLRRSSKRAVVEASFAGTQVVSIFLSAVGNKGREALSYPLGLAVAAFKLGERKAVSRSIDAVVSSGSPVESSTRRPFLEFTRSYARFYLDSIWLQRASFDAVRRHVIADFGLLDAARQSAARRGLGVIHCGPHMATSLVTAARLGVDGVPVSAVARHVDGSFLSRLLEHSMKRFGIELISVDPRTSGGVVAHCVDSVQRGRVLWIMGDVYLNRPGSRPGLIVDIAGTRRVLGPGVVVVGLKTGAPIICGTTVWDRGRSEVHFNPHLDPIVDAGEGDDAVTVLAQRIADQLSGLVQLAPAQWRFVLRSEATTQPSEAGLEHPMREGPLTRRHSTGVERAPSLSAGPETRHADYRPSSDGGPDLR